ncbi:MAG: glycosyltransferase family 4 protein [Candidatus Omnitrophica bacterium]|nr:glycosyltransferase family 4 protein [Candidatus Omnitrophota bacterium]
MASAKMKILMLFSTSIPPADGIARHVVSLSKKLRERGHEVILMTRGGMFFQESQFDGFRLILVPFCPLYPFHVHLQKALINGYVGSLAGKVDIAHLHSPLVPALDIKIPIVATFHTTMIVDTAKIENVGIKSLAIKIMGRTTSYWVEKRIARSAAAIIAPSPEVKLELLKYYLRGDKHVDVLYNTVDSRVFSPGGNAVRGKIVLYVGRLSYRKGLFDLIESAKYIVRVHGDAEFRIVGDGPLRGEVEKSVHDNGLRRYFTYCGEVTGEERVREEYRNASVVVIPSHYESGPITFLEAMSSGKAVVTTPVGYAKDLAVHRVNALVVPPSKPRELSKAVIELLLDPDLANRIGAEARRTILEKVDAERTVTDLEGIYRRVLENGRRVC